MKSLNKIYILSVVLIAAIFTSCENEDYLVFTAAEPSEAVTLLSEIQQTYLISEATSSNIAERIVWSEPDFGAPTPNVYLVEMSLTSDFSTIDMSSGDISENFLSLHVSDLLDMAEAKGLSPGDSGSVYGKVTAYAGSSLADAAVSSTSDVFSMTIEMLEVYSCDELVLSNWGLVGSAVNSWGNINRGYAATNDIEMLTDGNGVYNVYASLLDGEFKFRQDGDWGVNYGDTGADGNIDAGGDNLAITAGTYHISLDLNNNTYSVGAVTTDVWGIVGSGVTIEKDDGSGDVAECGNGANDTKFTPDPCNEGVFLLKGVGLRDGEIKFRQDDDWGVNLGDTGADGSLDAGGDNIVVTAGTYNIMLDITNNTYTIQKL